MSATLREKNDSLVTIFTVKSAHKKMLFLPFFLHLHSTPNRLNMLFLNILVSREGILLHVRTVINPKSYKLTYRYSDKVSY